MRRVQQLLMMAGVSVLVVAMGATALAVVGVVVDQIVAEEFVDSDSDGVSDADEALIGMDPQDPDSDSTITTEVDESLNQINDGDEDLDEDGLTNAEELNIHGTDPLKEDSDDDGVTDGDELNILETDPLDEDSDDNGTNDGDEDFDGDGLTNAEELNVYGTDPLIANEIVEGGECHATFAGGILVVDFEGEVLTFDLTSEMTGKKLNHGRVVSTVAKHAPQECHGEIVSAVAQTDWGKAGNPLTDDPTDEEKETELEPGSEKGKKPNTNR